MLKLFEFVFSDDTTCFWHQQEKRFEFNSKIPISKKHFYPM